MERASANDVADTEICSLLRKVARVEDCAVSQPLPQVGSVIGDKYQVELLLGRGGMGAVFRATHVLSRKAVAVKWMLRSSTDERARGRFLREARAAGRIDHPNVVDVYDVGQEGHAYYLVMELLHGETLRARIERGMLPFESALRLLLPAMRGVAAVHAAGVVHRDLKPENIFLCKSPDGGPREAKVLDFGISAVRMGGTDEVTLTEEGSVLGTPGYMSPEQLQGTGDIDARSDVYAFGVILYEVLTGQLPIVADTYAAMVLAAVHRRPRPLRELNPGVPMALERVVMRALEKRRTDRHATIAELIAELTPFAAAEGARRHAAPGHIVPKRKRALLLLIPFVVGSFGLAHWSGQALGGDWGPPSSEQEQLTSEVQPSVRAQRDVSASQPGATAEPSPLLETANVLDAQPTTIIKTPSLPPPIAAPLMAAAKLLPPSAATEKRHGSDTDSSRPHRNATARRLSEAQSPRGVAAAVSNSPEPSTACDPPYSVDVSGHIQFKPECL